LGDAWAKQTYGTLVLNQPVAFVERAKAAIVFVFCGNGAGRSDLVARCEGLPNVQFLDLQTADRLPDLLATADIHLLPQRADAADLVMPSKLTGMLASARAVIATAHAGTELATVIQGCGLVVPPGDAVAFAQAVLGLAADPALREQLGAAGFLYAQAHLDREAVLQQFEAQLLALVGHAPSQDGV
jgi:colanic acid biosynthesis glycosyl transferase WcaI